MKGKQLKDFFELIQDSSRKQGWPFKDYTEDYRREWDSYRRDDGTYDNPYGGDPLTQEDVDKSISDRVAQDNKKTSLGGILGLDFSGLKEVFKPFTDLFSTFGRLVGGLFSGVSNLPDNELFNQGYSWLNQFTGANLTGKEQQMNQFNAEQAAIQRGWQERMSNTSFQRQVADMQLAGINPAMSMGSNGASTPSGSAASGTASPAQAAAILEMILGAKKIQTEKEMNLRSTASAERIAEINAGAHVKAAEIAAGASMYGSNKTAEGKARENELREKELEMNKQESLKRIDLLMQQAKSEEEKAFYYKSYTRLNNVNADKIEEMIPYEKAYMDASTQEKKAIAAYNWAQAAYQNGLIDSGMIDAVVRSTEQNANESEQKAIAERFENQLKHGYQPEGSNYTISPWLQRVIVFLKAVSKSSLFYC